MNHYICVGYDIWLKPEYSIDFTNSSTWDRDEFYEDAKINLKIEENFLQLLSPLNDIELNKLLNFVNENNKYVLVSVEIEKIVYEYVERNYSVKPVVLGNLSFSLIGFDICDIKGFFSVFDMGINFFNRKKLLNIAEIENKEAFFLINLANYLIPQHAPFHLVKLCVVTK